MSRPDPERVDWPALSVVMPVREEARHLRASVRRILAQDYPGPVEVVLALGPSRDDTHRIARELAAEHPGLRLVDNPSGRTPDALNAALAAATGEVVARVDGHALLPPGYLRRAVDVLQETGAVNVGGIMAAEGTTPFERAVARAMTSPFGVGAGRFHYGGEAGPADTVYLGVFRRAALHAVGGYDPRFARAQDWELNHRLRGAGGLVWFTPELRVTYRPRPTLRALARQYRDYGRWRRVVMRRHPDSVRLHYLVPPVAVLGVAGGAVLAATGRRIGLVPPLTYAAAVLLASAYEGGGLPLPVRARLPLVFATMHGAWGVGFLTSPRRLAVEPTRVPPAP
ncbi:MAG: glycosyltransferase family 2 protein [Actinomycetota bacterium]|nr:glycosyltransferase family 2 protein [Actinomycetota bacterium]